jgi:hypothetical protein
MAWFDPVGEALSDVLQQYTGAQVELILEFTERNNEAIRNMAHDGTAPTPDRSPARGVM